MGYFNTEPRCEWWLLLTCSAIMLRVERGLVVQTEPENEWPLGLTISHVQERADEKGYMLKKVED